MSYIKSVKTPSDMVVPFSKDLKCVEEFPFLGEKRRNITVNGREKLPAFIKATPSSHGSQVEELNDSQKTTKVDPTPTPAPTPTLNPTSIPTPTPITSPSTRIGTILGGIENSKLSGAGDTTEKPSTKSLILVQTFALPTLYLMS